MKIDKNTKRELLTGNMMPILGLGTWQIESPADTVRTAIEMGYPMIDTSSDYGTQPGIGEAINNTGTNDTEIFITTKVEEDDDSYDRTISNLKELDIAKADLVLIHRPPQNGAGVKPWKGLIRAQKEGLVQDIGVSNYNTEEIDELIKATDVTPVVNQIEWSPFGYSEEMLIYCNEKGIVIQAYSPLTRTKRLDNEVLDELSDIYGKSPAQIILRWNLQVGTVPIPKASGKDHLQENLDIFDFQISNEDMQLINSLNEHYSSLGRLQYI